MVTFEGKMAGSSHCGVEQRRETQGEAAARGGFSQPKCQTFVCKTSKMEQPLPTEDLCSSTLCSLANNRAIPSHSGDFGVWLVVQRLGFVWK